MRWMDIKHGKGMPDKRTINIPVRQLGIAKVVVVKTKKNGGL
jgi:hypothetical protein